LSSTNFPEFVTDILPEHKKAIDDLALQIIRSNQTADPIFAFRVEGFADIARTIPLGQQKQFEDEISSERADNGFVLLLEALKKLGGEDFAKKIARDSKALVLVVNVLRCLMPPPKLNFERIGASYSSSEKRRSFHLPQSQRRRRLL
jgi:hypothetical protein